MAGTIVVLGAGAIGGVLGGRMAAAGTPVWLVDGWAEHVQAMRGRGLLMDGMRGELRASVQALTFDELDTLPGPISVAFLACKSYDTEAIVEQVRPLLAPDGVIVSLQNGLNEETIARLIGPQRTIGAVTRLSGWLIGAGHVREMRDPVPFGIGELDGRITDRLRTIAALMEPAAPSELTDNIWGKLWSKLLLNCIMNPSCGVSGLTGGQIWEHPVGRRLLFRVCQEGIDVGRAAGIRWEPAGGMDMELLATRDPALRARAEEHADEYTRASGQVRPSMLQDILKGRRTEIDYLNGFIVRKAQEQGREVPANAALVRMVKEIEAGQRPMGVENLDELAAQLGLAQPADAR